MSFIKNKIVLGIFGFLIGSWLGVPLGVVPIGIMSYGKEPQYGAAIGWYMFITVPIAWLIVIPASIFFFKGLAKVDSFKEYISNVWPASCFTLILFGLLAQIVWAFGLLA